MQPDVSGGKFPKDESQETLRAEPATGSTSGSEVTRADAHSFTPGPNGHGPMDLQNKTAASYPPLLHRVLCLYFYFYF